ncbi:TonB-dependent receptor [Caulobacter mirabilis]|uniref:TonB-dependent receptor n=1 Tax=Caulobacter mirabilis TaxID=69666 RepID=A0A2D2AY25_9CAUL|nr:TonB-dependent receptor [Caulobacter mirabilis]ATQ42920.1 hypothetical protein CSW64_11125 [Caulobacter mirabilis]
MNTKYLTTTVVGLALMAASSADAQAPADKPQEQDAAQATQLEDIIITAQKRETNLQDTPGAIAALGAEAIAKLGVNDVTGLRGLVPNVSIGEPRLASSSIIAIRGIAGQDGGVGQDEPVALYLDGVYLARPQGQLFALTDIARIEVLKGPQGTLYGRNSTAGAINIVTSKPRSEFGGLFEAGLGNYGATHARGSIEGALASRLSARLSGSYSNFDGDLKNTFTGGRERSNEEWLGRFVARYDLSDAGGPSIDLSADYGEATSSGSAMKNLTINGGRYGDPDRVAFDLPDRGMTRATGGANVTVEQAFSNGLKLTSITGYRYLDLDVRYDADGTNIADFQNAIAAGRISPAAAALRDSSSYQYFHSNAYSQELRLAGRTDSLKWIVGAYAYDETTDFRFTVNLLAQSLNRLSSDTIATAGSTSYATYGHLEWTLNDQFELQGGLRYSYERKTMDRNIVTGAPPAATVESLSKSWDDITGDITLNYRPVDGVLAYVTFAQGFKSGGFNASQALSPAFNPERVTSYEAGLKTDLFDRRARLNIAAFHMKYTDLQVRFASGIGQTTIQNAAEATINGVEIDTQARVGSDLTVSLNGAYQEAKYDKYQLGALDLSGNYLNQAPRWSMRAALDYNRPIADAGDLSVHAGYSWQSREFYRAQNDPISSNPGYENLEGRIGFSPSAFDGVAIEIWGKNLTDDRYVGGVIPLASDLVFIGSINRGRTYGFDIRYRF